MFLSFIMLMYQTKYFIKMIYVIAGNYLAA